MTFWAGKGGGGEKRHEGPPKERKYPNCPRSKHTFGEKFSFVRLKQKTTTPVVWSFALSWRIYIRAHIVSEHAKRIIGQFMAACCSKSKTEDIFLGEAPLAPTAEERNEACAFSLQQVHAVLKSATELKEKKTRKATHAEAEEGPSVFQRRR